jgi:putative FmdB family regulatory protein
VPTYQYRCTECSHHLEAAQSFTDDPLTTCPECQGRLRKVFSSVGVVFKGPGFYRTDSRAGKSASSEPASTAKEKPASETSTSTKADSSGGGTTSSSPAPAAPAAASGSAK